MSRRTIVNVGLATVALWLAPASTARAQSAVSGLAGVVRDTSGAVMPGVTVDCVTPPSDARLPGGGGNPICGFYDVSQNKFGQIQNVITQASNFGRQEDVYDGVDLTTNVRLSKGVLLSGGVNTGRERTNNCFVLDRPDLTFAGTATGVTAPRTPAFCDVRPPFQTQLKLFAVYPLPWWGVQAAATFQSLPGPPITAS
jgi:hypothetical protein